MPVEPQAFKNSLAQWASGVTVVTSVDTPAGALPDSPAGSQRVGITASSFASVSLEPPRVLICINKRLYTHGLIERSRVFAVNILNDDQLGWGMLFAGMLPEVDDRFAGIDWRVEVTGSPILPGVLAWLDCRVVHAYDGGDHTIFVGEVEATGTHAIGAPLLYYNRQWRKLDAARPVQP
ncbi:MAG: flavin reductase [Chloroflexi bacterium]|nr:MAG: flavin reductase [Chloroflexota bacterium]